jgi:hypothetical protein
MAFALAALATASELACNPVCATWVIAATVEDETTGELLCDATVTLVRGDAGTVIDASTSSSDAEVPAMSQACQWDVVVNGGTFVIRATAPGFEPGTTTVTLPSDECGTATAPVMVVLSR